MCYFFSFWDRLCSILKMLFVRSDFDIEALCVCDEHSCVGLFRLYERCELTKFKMN